MFLFLFFFCFSEGRATMVSAFASFKFGVAFCFTQLISVLMVFYVSTSSGCCCCVGGCCCCCMLLMLLLSYCNLHLKKSANIRQIYHPVMELVRSPVKISTLYWTLGCEMEKNGFWEIRKLRLENSRILATFRLVRSQVTISTLWWISGWRRCRFLWSVTPRRITNSWNGNQQG